MPSQPRTIGRYEVERELGRGGMGAVYLARDPAIGRRVAIKVLRTDDEEYRRRFRIEVNAAGALRHRHIVTIFDSGEHEGSPYLAMEYVPGETLAQKIARRESLPLAEKLRLIIEVCDGLSHAHRVGIVHRDMKPANVIVDDDDQSVKIVDFGIARIAGSGATTTMTQTGAVVGTLTYMAPEQVQGKSVDHRADIFSTGCVLYELLSYERAFPGGIEDGLMYRIVHEPHVDLARRVQGIDREITDIVDRALRKDPAERFGGIKEMSAALASVRDRLQQPSAAVTMYRPAAATPGPATQAGATQSKRRGVLIGTGVLVLVAAGVGAWIVMGRPEAEPSNTSPAPVQQTPVSRPTSEPVAAPTPPPVQDAATPSPSAVTPETRLRIDAPADAVVTLDGAASARDTVVRAGTYTLRARRPGVIGTREQRVSVAEGQTRTITPDLGTGTVVRGDLPFPYTSATVNGEPVTGRTPALNGQLVAEFVSEAGSAAQRQRIPFELATGAERDLSTLVPRGSLRFEVAPAADVSIDVRTFGNSTEGSLARVAAGEYTIRLVRAGYRDFTDRVRVSAGDDLVLRYGYNFATGSWVRR